MASVKKRTLTEAEWRNVFRIRCKTKQGQPISDDERKLIDDAFVSDEKRYSAMNGDVFNATAPFGSATRWKK